MNNLNDNISKSFLNNEMFNDIYNNEFILPILAVVITLYSVMITPKIHSPNLKIYNNMLFKLLLIGFIYFITTKNKMLGIILTISILFTILNLSYNNSIYKISQTYENNYDTNYDNNCDNNCNCNNYDNNCNCNKSNNSNNNNYDNNNHDNNHNDDNTILLTPRKHEIMKESLNNRNNLMDYLTSNDVPKHNKEEINNDILIQDHIIDSILKVTENEHYCKINNSNYHKNIANKYKIKLDSLINSNKLRNILKKSNNNDNDVKKILLLLTHENNKIDLVNNINNEYLNYNDAINKNDDNLAKEHYTNIENYEIQLHNDMSNVIHDTNYNLRESNNLSNLNPLNIDNTNSLILT